MGIQLAAKRHGMRRLRRRETLMDILFVGPQFILYLGLSIVPLIVALPMLFREQKSLFVKAGRFVGLDNFAAVFQKPLVDIFVPALLKTLLFVGTNYVMVWVFGLSFALLMYELSDRVRRRFFIIIFLPYLLSGFGVGMIISMLFSSETGSLTLLFRQIGLGTGHLDIYSPSIHALIPLFEGWQFARFNMALFLGGLLAIPPETIDSSKVDGARYLQRLRQIYLPQMVPTIILVTVMCMMSSFGIFEVPIGLNALQGNRQVMFMAVLIYSQGFQAGSLTGSAANLGHVVATSILVYLPLLVVAFVLRRLQQRTQYE